MILHSNETWRLNSPSAFSQAQKRKQDGTPDGRGRKKKLKL